MKNRSKKISKIVSIAASDERRHGVAAGKSRLDLEAHRARLGELHAYRHDYCATSQTSRSINSAHWQDYQKFLQRLDQAVSSQRQIVRDSEQNLALHRQRWQEKRQRLDSLQKVLERYRDGEKVDADRQQQRALDDLPAPGNPFSDDLDS